MNRRLLLRSALTFAACVPLDKIITRATCGAAPACRIPRLQVARVEATQSASPACDATRARSAVSATA